MVWVTTREGRALLQILREAGPKKIEVRDSVKEERGPGNDDTYIE